MSFRILYLTAESCPAFRIDISVLFGKVLPKYGILSDIVAQKAPEMTGAKPWQGGEAILCDVSDSRAKTRIMTFLHGCKHMLIADPRRYQAIQVRDMPLMAIIAIVAARFKGLKCFYWMSYPMPDGQILLARERGLSEGLIKFLFPWLRGRIGYFLLYRIVLHQADHVFVQSDQMKMDLLKRGIGSEKMTPVPMGVDLEAVENFTTRTLSDVRLTGKRVLVYLGSQERSRRIEILFEMLVIVKNRFPNVLLVLVGDANDPSHRRWLRMKADQAGVSENLLWTGWLPMMEGWRYVQNAEIGLSPFPRGYLLDSASPTKVLEYLILGVPVVCNDNPDQQQVIEQSGAGICVPYSAKNFAEAVLSLLQAPLLRAEMAKHGVQYVSEMRNYDSLGKGLARKYHVLLGSSLKRK